MTRRPAPARRAPNRPSAGWSPAPSSDEGEQAAQLLLFLEVAVPMWATCVAGWPAERRTAEAAAAADVIAHGADVVFRRGDPRRGHPGAGRRAAAGSRADGAQRSEVFAAIALGVALGALKDGGVTFLGQHWCAAPHGDCRGAILAAWLPQDVSPPRAAKTNRS